ncbi:MAG: hypothetical protein GF364_14745 [Candidatus Lokiarchaeota archaeon]|nr:hypothetical protein [Candidatus Lokiarchaeota archaeon]
MNMGKYFMKIAVLDIETTSFKPDEGSLIEIGICQLDLETGKIMPLFDNLIQEHDFDPSLEAWIYKNSDITPELILSEGVPAEEVVEDLQQIFDKFYITAYNHRFDFTWLEHRGFQIKKVAPDPMQIASQFFRKMIKKENGSTSTYYVKTLNVQECLEFFQIDETEIHRAYSDCVHEAKIIYELYKKKLYEIL